MIKQMTILIISICLINLVSAAHPLPTKLTEDGGMMEGMANWAYNVTNGTFFAMLLLGFCIVLFIAASKYSTDRAFGYAGTAGIFGSLFLVTLGLLSWWLATIFIIAGAIGIVSMILREK